MVKLSLLLVALAVGAWAECRSKSESDCRSSSSCFWTGGTCITKSLGACNMEESTACQTSIGTCFTNQFSRFDFTNPNQQGNFNDYLARGMCSCLLPFLTCYSYTGCMEGADMGQVCGLMMDTLGASYKEQGINLPCDSSWCNGMRTLAEPLIYRIVYTFNQEVSTGRVVEVVAAWLGVDAHWVVVTKAVSSEKKRFRTLATEKDYAVTVTVPSGTVMSSQSQDSLATQLKGAIDSKEMMDLGITKTSNVATEGDTGSASLLRPAGVGFLVLLLFVLL
eukprot:Sspe_Gene.50198::Locus_27743_Transcript_1_1_Confidence_1.000_Length_1102::g.50198::m.50198